MIITVLHCRERKKRGKRRGEKRERERGMRYWKRGASAAIELRKLGKGGWIQI